MTDPAIAVMPYGLNPGPAQSDLPLDQLHWPLGCPDRLTGGTLSDLTQDDHLIVFPKTKLHFQFSMGTRAQVSLLMGEPSVIHARHYALLRLSHRRFFRVLTFNQDALARLPNSVCLPYGTTWVPHWRDVDRTKSRHMSLIASAKRDTQGHKLRHDMVERLRASRIDADVMGRGYTPFDDKAEGLAPYRFSVVIENMREPNYFSEKLIDAILCDTVPIYWGCPNLDQFMDTAGIIQCIDADSLWQAITQADQAGYERRLPHLEAIKPVALSYCDLELRAAKAIRAAL